MEINKKQEEDL